MQPMAAREERGGGGRVPEDEELLLLAVVARDEAEGPRLLLNGTQGGAARASHRSHAVLWHVLNRDVAHLVRVVNTHLCAHTPNRSVGSGVP